MNIVSLIPRLREEVELRYVERLLIFDIINKMPDKEAKEQLLKELKDVGITQEISQKNKKEK